MIRHGEAPYIECSTKGFDRFSAFHARVYIYGLGMRSIEAHYQAYKVFEDGSTGLEWHQAKGRKAVNQDACNALYSRLWDKYISLHNDLQTMLIGASGLSDIFGQPGHVCQATELWRIRGELLKSLNPL